MDSEHPKLPVPLNASENHQLVFESSTGQQASLPVDNPTTSFWLYPPSANKLAKVGSTGSLTDDADICIIGSGITGVGAAYHLAKLSKHINQLEPLKVVIIEARDFCSGATGRNGGHLTPASFLDFSTNLKTYGKEEAIRQYALESHTTDDLVEFLRTNKLEEAVDLVEGGHVELFLTPSEEEDVKLDYDDALKSGAVDPSRTQWYTKEDMLKMHGTKFPGVHIPGFNLWPMKLVTELFLEARKLSNESGRMSLSLHTNTPVTSIIPSGKQDSNRRWEVRTHRGAISSRVVLHATNGYASYLLPHMAGPEGIIPTRGQIIATRAVVSREHIKPVSWGGNEGFEYWFPRSPSKGNDDATDPEDKPVIILGGGREVTKPKWEFYETDDSIIQDNVTGALKEFLPVVFPGKFRQDAEPEMVWTGIMGFTKLRDPFVGPVIDPEDPDKWTGQYISAGYTGHGMPRTYACAEAVVSLILHELAGGTRSDWAAPKWFPLHYLTWIRDTQTRK